MKIAILGAGGMLGHKLYETLSATFPETVAVFRKPPAYYADYGLFDLASAKGGFDACKIDQLDRYLKTIKPDVVINCIGLTTRKLGGQNSSDIILVNAYFPHRLKEWCAANDAKLIHFSTDCVFSGKGGPYAPDHPYDAKDLYGLSKALGEVEGPGILTIRSSIVGLEIEGKTELIEWFLSQRGKRIRGFSGVMYSGVTTVTMANVVRELLVKGALDGNGGGIHQLASEPISKYELLKVANGVFDAKVTIEEDTTVKSNKVLQQSPFFTDLGIHAPSWRAQLEAVAKSFSQYERWSTDVERKRKAS